MASYVLVYTITMIQLANGKFMDAGVARADGDN